MKFKIPRLDSPLNRTKKKEVFNDRLPREWKKLKQLFEAELKSYEKDWSVEDWREKAGLYADMVAVKTAVCDEDCFHMQMEDGTMNPDTKDKMGYAARLANRLVKEGAGCILQSVKDSFSVGMSWQSRSGDPDEIVQVIEIGF